MTVPCFARVSQQKFLIAIFMSAFCVRLLFFLIFLAHNNNYLVPCDSVSYLEIAHSFVHGLGYSTSYGEPAVYRLPCYPLFLAFCYKIFDEVIFAIILQLLIASLIPILFFFLAKKIIPKRIDCAILAACIGCIHVGFVQASGVIMTETLFILFFLVFMLCFVHALQQKRIDLMFVAGLLLGITSLIRPVGHYLIILMILVCLCSPFADFIKKIWQIGLLLIGWLVMVVPLLLRNYLLFGQLFFHTLPGDHFLHLVGAPIIQQVTHCSHQEALSTIDQQADKIIQQQKIFIKRPLNAIEQCTIKERYAWRLSFLYPTIAIRIIVTDLIRTICSFHSSYLIFLETGKSLDACKHNNSFWRRFCDYVMPPGNALMRIIVWFDMLLHGLILFGFVGFLCNLIMQIRIKNFLQEYFYHIVMCSIIIFFIGISLAGGYARLRLPSEPLMILGALYWLSVSNKFMVIQSQWQLGRLLAKLKIYLCTLKGLKR